MPSAVLSPQLGWERNNQCASRPGCTFAGITIGWKNPACRMSDFGQGDRLLSSRLSPRVRLLNTLRLVHLFIFFIFFFPTSPPLFPHSQPFRRRGGKAAFFSPSQGAVTGSCTAALAASPPLPRGHRLGPECWGGHTRC